MSITDLKVILSRTMGYFANDNTELGTMYELFQGEQYSNKFNIKKKIGVNSVRKEWRMFSMQYLVKLKWHMTKSRKKLFYFLHCSLSAIPIVKTYLDYDNFENNCQNFAKYLLEIICPDSQITQTIVEILQGLQNIENLMEQFGTLPQAYPQSINDYSFKTASDTY